MRHAVGIAGLRSMIVGIVAESGRGTCRLRQGGQQVDRVIAVGGGSSYGGERGQIAYWIEAGGDHRATGERLGHLAIVGVVGVAS